MTWKRGFTLIELLIVVAIIAILAAIAVPNFLEAQTRAKVSRVKSDMRTAATGVQAFAVDNNRYPFDYFIDPQNIRLPPPDPPPPSTRNFRMRHIVVLTTPISYLTSVNLSDPFLVPTGEGVENNFGYFNFQHRWGNDAGIPVAERSRTVMMKSWGPDRSDDGAEWIINGINDARAGILNVNRLYDPTNGTVSRGDVARFVGDTRGLPEQL